MRFLFRLLIRLGVTLLITLTLLIRFKSDGEFKEQFYRLVYESNFNFAQVNYIYQSYFGSVFPFKDWLKTQAVFKEQLTFSAKEAYLEGVKLSVGNDYLVPVIKSGLVVFIGEKEGYGNVVVVEQIDGIDCWYGNLDHANIKLYDYVEAGTLLGSANNHLYLIYKKDGKAINYEDYI